jgi:hypothetical protein
VRAILIRRLLGLVALRRLGGAVFPFVLCLHPRSCGSSVGMEWCSRRCMDSPFTSATPARTHLRASTRLREGLLTQSALTLRAGCVGTSVRTYVRTRVRRCRHGRGGVCVGVWGAIGRIQTTRLATHDPRHPSIRTVSDHVRGFGLQATQLPVHEAPQAVELQPCLPRVHTAPQAAPFGSRRQGGSSGTSGGVPKATTPRARACVFSMEMNSEIQVVRWIRPAHSPIGAIPSPLAAMQAGLLNPRCS